LGLNNLIKEFKACRPLIKQGYKVLGKDLSVSFPGPSMPSKSELADSGIGSPFGDGAKRVHDFFGIFSDKILLGPGGRTFAPNHSPYESTLGYNPFFIPLEKLTQKSFGELLSKQTLQKIYRQDKTAGVINFNQVAESYHFALTEIYNTYRSKRSNKAAFALRLEQALNNFIKSNPYIFADAVYYGVFAAKNKTRDYHSWAAPELEKYKQITQHNDLALLSKAEVDRVNQYIFADFLSFYCSTKCKYNYIGDIQVKIPDSIVCAHSELFLSDFTLGCPPDMYSATSRDWNFRVLNPKHMFNADGSLGKAGKLLYDIFDHSIRLNKAGVRVDHYIGMVNPYVISHDPNFKNGRLYSSYDHPYLAAFSKHSIPEFSKITTDIILKAAKANGLDYDAIYVEDLGSRPEQLDPVIDACKLGRMAIAQFVNIDDEHHLYRLKNVRPKDVSVMDTHDSASVFDFFDAMDMATRRKHALALAHDLRWQYSDDLLSTEYLSRMKWAELLACPSTRVQAFFTSFTGQQGRYNKPGHPVKWVLRCQNDFESLYFKNLYNNRAFNPFDAIALAIHARGDHFYVQNEDLVHELRARESYIKNVKF